MIPFDHLYLLWANIIPLCNMYWAPIRQPQALFPVGYESGIHWHHG
jgi:hypothetical protein